MATTYSEDTDITNREPQASTLNDGSTDFSRQRQIAYDEIGRRLIRRSPAIVQSALGIITELKEAEIRFTLHRLYFEASSRAADDPLWAKAQAYRREFEDEIMSAQLPVDSVPSCGSSPIRRS